MYALRKGIDHDRTILGEYQLRVLGNFLGSTGSGALAQPSY